MNVHRRLETNSVKKTGRRFAWLGVVLFLVLPYVGSYYHLSRRGLAEAATLRAEGFLYTPLNITLASQDLSKHYTLSTIFAPLNLLDRNLIGTPGPMKCILFDLE